MLEKIKESSEQEQINKKLEEIKKQEGEEVKVDANFGIAQANADQFKDVSLKIIKKRVQPEGGSSIVNEAENLKRQKLDENQTITTSVTTNGHSGESNGNG